MAGRHQPSTIDQLPEEVRALIGELRQRRGATIDAIMAHLQLLDVPEAAEISRSALGRHVKKLDEIGERMRRSREMATALVDRFGDQPDNKLARLNLELMHGVVMQTITAAGGDPDGTEDGEDAAPVTFSPEDAKFLAGALASLAQAQKTDTDRTLKERAAFAKEAAEAVEDVAKKEGGMSAATLAAVRSRILGLGKPA